MAISFKPINSRTLRVNLHRVKTGETIAVGDPVELDADGLIICATASSAKLAGVAAQAVTSAAAGTKIGIYDDPKQVYLAKADNVSEVLQAVKGDEVDLIGSTGAFLVNLGASATDVFKVVDIGSERDPLLAAASSTFYSQNDGTAVFVEINSTKHAFGS